MVVAVVVRSSVRDGTPGSIVGGISRLFACRVGSGNRCCVVDCRVNGLACGSFTRVSSVDSSIGTAADTDKEKGATKVAHTIKTKLLVN
jgi:hypothetical protein